MITDLTSTITALSVLAFGQAQAALPVTPHVLASQQMSLEDRYQNRWVNSIFKDNILLNLAYLRGSVPPASKINWNEVQKPFIFQFKLSPNQTFAYHDDVLDQYKGKVVKTTNAHFNAQEGFKSDGYLFGDGVCHLASLIYWVAKEANLDAVAPTNHDFARITGVPRENGVSIYNAPGAGYSNKKQNLYITNNRSKTIAFKFEYNNNSLKVSAVEAN